MKSQNCRIWKSDSGRDLLRSDDDGFYVFVAYCRPNTLLELAEAIAHALRDSTEGGDLAEYVASLYGESVIGEIP